MRSVREQWNPYPYLTGLWLFGLILPPALDSEYRELLWAASALWIGAVGLVVGHIRFVYSPILRGNQHIFFLLMGLGGVFTVSAIQSANPLSSLTYTALAMAMLVSAAGVWQLIGKQIHRVLVSYAALGTCLMAFVYTNADEFSVAYNGRLSFGILTHPNHLGLVAFSIVAASLAAPGMVFRLGMITLNLAAILLAQARGSLVACFSMLATYLVFSLLFRKAGRRRLHFIALVALLGGLALTAVFEDEVWSAVNTMLLLDHRDRGLGSGFSGRLDAWDEAAALFFENPVFGVGLRQHEQYMVILGSAHNGYLSLLAETGILGGGFTFALLGATGFRLFRFARGGDPAAIIGFSFLIGYCTLAMFERLLINSGNPMSALMFVLLFMPGPTDLGRGAVGAALNPLSRTVPMHPRNMAPVRG